MSLTTAAAVCEVCTSTNVRLKRHSAINEFDVGQCQDCGLVYVLDPPREADIEAQYEVKPPPDGYLEMLRPDDPIRLEVLDGIRSLLDLAPGVRPSLFDVGAGAGDFVKIAGEHGFDATGNDISPEAVTYAAERFGVVLTDKMLDELPESSYDALTMWCVLAHVPDPLTFLQDALRLLKPGGVLFLRTPRWCAIDTVAFSVSRMSGNRWSKVADRRVAKHHLRMYDEHTLDLLLQRAGFAGTDVRGACHYTFDAKDYLRGAGLGDGLAARIAPPFERMISKDRFVRNVLFSYARKPLD